MTKKRKPFRNSPSMRSRKARREFPREPSAHTWVDNMKQELEDYIEDQGIYIRQ